MFRKPLLIVALSITILAIALVTPSVTAAPPAVPHAACRSSAWLTPKESSGPWWQEHRHWLEASFSFDGGSFTIINMRESRSYDWKFWGNIDGHAQFGVSTWYTVAASWWQSDPWLLVYNCN